MNDEKNLPESTKKPVRKPKPVGAEGHRARMLERFEKCAGEGMDDRQLLEILLFYALPRVDTRDQAVRLIEAFGSLDGVLSAPKAELVKVDGIGPRAADLLRLVDFISVSRTSPEVIPSKSYPDDEAIGGLFVKSFAGVREECVIAAAFDGKKRLITLYRSPTGSHGSCCVAVRTLTDFIGRTRASYIALAHNHPKGKLIASIEDREFTVMLDSLLPMLEIGFLGHFIVSENEFVRIWV